MRFRKIPLKPSTKARDAFTGRARRDIDSHHFLGPIKGRITYFNGSMTWMQGKALVKNGSQDLFCEFEGDPQLIERRFGGSVERSHEKAPSEDPVSFDAEANPTATQEEESKNVPNLPYMAQRSTADTNLMHPDLDEGPACNTRSRAISSLRGRGGRKTTKNPVTGSAWRRISNEKLTVTGGEGKEKGKAEDTDNLAQITAGIVSFSVYSNHQNEGDPPAANFGPPFTGTDATHWVHPANYSTKVGGWLENKEQADSQAPVDTPPSQAPSSFANVIIE